MSIIIHMATEQHHLQKAFLIWKDNKLHAGWLLDMDQKMQACTRLVTWCSLTCESNAQTHGFVEEAVHVPEHGEQRHILCRS